MANDSSWLDLSVQELQAEKKWALNGGPFGSKLVSRDYVDDGVPVIRGLNLGGQSKFSSAGLVFVTEEKADELIANNAHPGDVLFTQRGTLGQVGIIPYGLPYKRYVISQSQMKLTVNQELANPLFVYYYFSDPSTITRLKNHAISAGVPHINLAILREFRISLPAVATQEKIVSILSAYDDLIESNLRRIEILEEMAQNLYREWFVKFRFPGHENMRMVDSELGEIPAGWDIGQLQDVVFLQRGFDLPKKRRLPGQVRIFAASGPVGTHTEAKVSGPGVVTGRSGTLGVVTYIDEDFWPLNTTLWGKEYPRGNPTYAFYLLSSLELQQFNSGAAVPTLNRNDIHNLPVVLPPSALMQTFTEQVGSMRHLLNNLRAKCDCLQRTRNLLLPKLISGQIDISDLDIDVSEEAA